MKRIQPEEAVELQKFNITQHGNEYYVVKKKEGLFDIFNMYGKFMTRWKKETFLTTGNLKFFLNKKTNIINY